MQEFSQTLCTVNSRRPITGRLSTPSHEPKTLSNPVASLSSGKGPEIQSLPGCSKCFFCKGDDAIELARAVEKMLRWNEIGNSSSFEVEVEIESERWLEFGGEVRRVSRGERRLRGHRREGRCGPFRFVSLVVMMTWHTGDCTSCVQHMWLPL